MIEHSEGCALTSHPCLKCKLRGWRDGSSVLGVAIPAGWKGPSVWELERRQHEEAEAAGIEIDRAPS